MFEDGAETAHSQQKEIRMNIDANILRNIENDPIFLEN